ncbi:MAG: GTP-binding protein, partial [Oscillospiraceae bacterium]
MKKIALGILAHVDSGKTTLSESILYRAGEIRKLGRVDHKDAFLDTHILEKDRGITIFSKQAVINLKNTTITLLDTPGHIDFSAEMERTLQVLDYAVLIISGTDGVQSHTKTLWKLLNKHKIPTFIFVNKMDLQVKSKSEILSHLKNQLDENCIDFSIQNSQDFYESIAVCDENILNGYMKNLSVDDNLIADAIKQRNIFPCFFGSALKLDGIDLFLEAIDKYTVSKKYCDKFSAKIFKISRDEQGNRLTHLKITGGVLKVKEAILYCDNQGNELSEKINQIRVYSGAKFQAIEAATSGTICAVTGLSKTFAGQGIGLEAKSSDFILEPVLTYKVTICDQTNVFTAYSNLKILEEEDPTLNIIWNEHLQEIHLQLMGEVQLEILKSIIMQRFNMNVDFGKGNIVYKETISNIVEGVGHYEPLRHYAEVHLLIEPLPNGSGVKVNSSCPEDELDKNWQRLVLS